MQKEELLSLLSTVIHPERGKDIVSAGMVDDIVITGDSLRFTLKFDRSRDPFALSIKRSCEGIIVGAHPSYSGKLSILIKESAPVKQERPKVARQENTIANIIAISSGKGGVGKSTVTANLAVSLASKGYRVGIIDADIYGPSMPKMFGEECYVPMGEKGGGNKDLIIPAESRGVKLMSIGFFIKADDALVWRGGMATNALRQLIHQTLWGDLDYLLIDLPPGTGDIHLTLVQELKLTGAIIVSTPQDVALADVRRGIKMFRSEGIDVPVLGIIENMAWFTPAELPDKRYYIFGEGGARKLAESENIPLLGEIPLIMSIRENGDNGVVVPTTEFEAIADYLVELSSKG